MLDNIVSFLLADIGWKFNAVSVLSAEVKKIAQDYDDVSHEYLDRELELFWVFQQRTDYWGKSVWER